MRFDHEPGDEAWKGFMSPKERLCHMALLLPEADSPAQSISWRNVEFDNVALSPVFNFSTAQVAPAADTRGSHLDKIQNSSCVLCLSG